MYKQYVNIEILLESQSFHRLVIACLVYRMTSWLSSKSNMERISAMLTTKSSQQGILMRSL